MNAFDLIVIGGGSGGIACAVRSATHGARVAVVEQNFLGGTCVNLGCVPKKVMWNAAYIQSLIKKSHLYGFSISQHQFNWTHLVEQRENYIKRLRSLYLERFGKLNITLLSGHGAFVKPNQISVNDHIYNSKHIVIATGGKPNMPNISGIEHALNSDDFFALTSQPKKVAIVGSGYIALEIAGVFNSLGTETHLFYRRDYPLTAFDESIKQQFCEISKSHGIHLHSNHSPQSLVSQNKIIFDKGEYDGFDAIFFATGRIANTDSINLQAADIITLDNKKIKTDEWQNTNIENHYALGDITETNELTPVAIKAGRQLAERLFNNQTQAKLDPTSIPTVAFTHPPIATIGLTESDARLTYDDIKIYKSKFNPMMEAFSAQEYKTPTFMKIIVEGKNERVVGLHMIGEYCDEILQGFAVAIKMGATKTDFDNTIAIHPTSAEEIVTM